MMSCDVCMRTEDVVSMSATDWKRVKPVLVKVDLCIMCFMNKLVPWIHAEKGKMFRKGKEDKAGPTPCV